jgi:cytochrome c2
LLSRLQAGDGVAGQIAAGRCAVCHSFGADEGTVVGPNLFGIVGAPVARTLGFDYSAALRAKSAEGAIWTFDALDAFLRDPQAAIPGNRMEFAGIPEDNIRANIVLFLRSLAVQPLPLIVTEAQIAPAPPPAPTPDPTALVFTVAQVEAGRSHYVRLGCDRCHGDNLMGVVDVREGEVGIPPALVAANFANRWFGRPVADLFDLLKGQKPIEAPGTLSDNIYVELIAFILATNGFAAGLTPLPTNRDALAELRIAQ